MTVMLRGLPEKHLARNSTVVVYLSLPAVLGTWLWDTDHGIAKQDCQAIIQTVKRLLYAHNESELLRDMTWSHKNLTSQGIHTLPVDLWECRSKWVLSYQSSQSPWASPVVLVKNRDGSYRFCVDYRHLNSITKMDVFPLPWIDDTLDLLSKAISLPGFAIEVLAGQDASWVK